MHCFVSYIIAHILFIGAVCRIDNIELGIAVQIQNIGEGFFFSPGPSSSDLMHTQVARLTTPTGTSAHEYELNEIGLRCFFRHGNPGCQNTIG